MPKAPKLLQKRERSVKQQVNDLIKPYGDKIWRYMAPASRFGMPALDFLLCVSGGLFHPSGYFIAVETKKPHAKPTPRQWETIKALRRAAAIVLVVRDNDGLKFLGQLLNATFKGWQDDVREIYGEYLTWETSLGFGGAPKAPRPRRGRRTAIPAVPPSREDYALQGSTP